MKNTPEMSLAEGISAAIRVGYANAVSTVTHPFHTAQVVLGLKPDRDVMAMIRDEAAKQKAKHGAV